MLGISESFILDISFNILKGFLVLLRGDFIKTFFRWSQSFLECQIVLRPIQDFIFLLLAFKRIQLVVGGLHL